MTINHLLAFLVSLVAVFLKGIQHQNVIGGHYRSAFLFSYLMAVADVLVIGFVTARGWTMAIPLGSGAAIGIVASMYIHRRFAPQKKTP